MRYMFFICCFFLISTAAIAQVDLRPSQNNQTANSTPQVISKPQGQIGQNIRDSLPNKGDLKCLKWAVKRSGPAAGTAFCAVFGNPQRAQ